MSDPAERSRRDHAISLRADIAEGDQLSEMIGWADSMFLLSNERITRLRLPDAIDPIGSLKNAPPEQTTFLNIGVTNILVARTVVQHKRLLNCVLSDDDPRSSKLLDIAWRVLISLASLDSILKRVEDGVAEVVGKVESDSENLISQDYGLRLPTVCNLDLEVRSFIVEAKRCLNTVSDLFSVLFAWPIRPGRFHEAQEKSKEQFGIASGLYRHLTETQNWVRYLIDLRIAIEHPAPECRVLVENFRMHASGGIHHPTLCFENNKGHLQAELDLLDFFRDTVEGILIFYERTLIFSLSYVDPLFPLIRGFEIIPDDEVNRECPVRWRQVVGNRN